MIYLLDTNACVEFLRRRDSNVGKRLNAIPRSQVAVCAPVVAELLFGAYRSNRPHENVILVQEFCATLTSLPFDDDAAYAISSLWATLAARGQLIGPMDLLIAGIALAHDLTLVTHNTREFSRVDGLRLEDWEVPEAGTTNSP